LLYEVDYKYDLFGNRIEADVDPEGDGDTDAITRYALDGWQSGRMPTSNTDWNVWAELDGQNSNALLTRYLRGDVVDQIFAREDGSGNAYWTLTDRLGSVRDVTDNAGAMKDTLSYDAYGNITSETASAYRGNYAWTGRELDGTTGLQYNRARWYDPKTGRWQSQDPLGFSAGDSSLYRYVKNDATDRTDPSGKAASDLFSCGDGDEKKDLPAKIKVSNYGGRTVAATKTTTARLETEWKLIIESGYQNGKRLNLAKNYEFRQLVTNRATLWDEEGTALSRTDAEKAFRDSGINIKDKKSPYFPWATQVLDVRAGATPSKDGWFSFKSVIKATLQDKHVTPVPYYLKDGKKQLYAMRFVSRMRLQVRLKGSSEEQEWATLTWSYTIQNFSGKAKSPILDNSAFGYYASSGIDSLPADLDFRTKK
jgi:RHS repeat-associated protein